jgi:DNA-binding PadR family transcriptional regulator
MAQENNIRYIILGMLAHEPMSGYDLKKRIDQTFSYFWPVGYGQIYTTLRQLRLDGLIALGSTEQSKGPQKSIFQTTTKGKQALQDWLRQPETKEYTRFEILLKLFFSSAVSTEVTLERIKAFETRHEANLATMQLFKDSLEPLLTSDPDHLYFYLTVLFGERIYSAYLAWAREATQLLGNKGIPQ